MATFLSRSIDETEKWAGEISSLFLPGMKIALKGDLGAGKTALVRGICRALGYTEDVHSPTYSLIHEYPTTPMIYHLDLYRLDAVQDLDDLGLDIWSMENAITLVEWPERLQCAYFKWDVVIELLKHSENERWIRWNQSTSQG